jgi:hypothetical protein
MICLERFVPNKLNKFSIGFFYHILIEFDGHILFINLEENKLFPIISSKFYYTSFCTTDIKVVLFKDKFSFNAYSF